MQYLALEILFRTEKRAPESRIALYETLVATRSWWDTVDVVAQKLIGPHLLRFSHLTTSLVEKWRWSTDLWINRTAILFQNRYRERTDLALLSSLVTQFAPSKEFFIQKAIGWALREAAKFDQTTVVAITDTVPPSPLSRREALKHLAQ